MGLETQCLKPVFETISNTDANFLNRHIGEAAKTRGDKQLYLITHLMKQTLNLNYNGSNGSVLKEPKTEKAILSLNLSSRSMVAISCFGSLSTLLYTSDLKWH